MKGGPALGVLDPALCVFLEDEVLDEAVVAVQDGVDEAEGESEALFEVCGGGWYEVAGRVGDVDRWCCSAHGRSRAGVERETVGGAMSSRKSARAASSRATDGQSSCAALRCTLE